MQCPLSPAQTLRSVFCRTMLFTYVTACVLLPTSLRAHDCEKLWHEATKESSALLNQAMDHNLEVFDSKGNLRHRPKIERSRIANVMRQTLSPAFELVKQTMPIPGCEKLFRADSLIVYHMIAMLDEWERGNYASAKLESQRMVEGFAEIGRFKEQDQP